MPQAGLGRPPGVLDLEGVAVGLRARARRSPPAPHARNALNPAVLSRTRGAEHRPDVAVAGPGEQPPRPRPVLHAAPGDVARADRHVGVVERVEQRRQPVRAGGRGRRPSARSGRSRARAPTRTRPGTPHRARPCPAAPAGPDPLTEPRELPDDRGGPVGAVVVDDEHVGVRHRGVDRLEQSLDVVGLVVGRHDHDAALHGSSSLTHGSTVPPQLVLGARGGRADPAPQVDGAAADVSDDVVARRDPVGDAVHREPVHRAAAAHDDPRRRRPDRPGRRAAASMSGSSVRDGRLHRYGYGEAMPVAEQDVRVAEGGQHGVAGTGRAVHRPADGVVPGDGDGLASRDRGRRHRRGDGRGHRHAGPPGAPAPLRRGRPRAAPAASAVTGTAWIR